MLPQADVHADAAMYQSPRPMVRPVAAIRTVCLYDEPGRAGEVSVVDGLHAVMATTVRVVEV